MFEREVVRAVIDAVLSLGNRSVPATALRLEPAQTCPSSGGQMRFAGLWLMSCRAAACTVFRAQPVVL